MGADFGVLVMISELKSICQDESMRGRGFYGMCRFLGRRK